MASEQPVDDGDIREWRSIVTLLVFIITNVIVLFPFHIPFYIPLLVYNALLDGLAAARIISPRPHEAVGGTLPDGDGGGNGVVSRHFKRLHIPMNLITAPIIADLFLLAISAIGHKEVKAGTVGADFIHPYDIMIFFITLAYIAISIDASGLVRWLAFKVLQWGGSVGHKLFFYLYAFFFGLGTLIGNDPIILSGTAFLAYMTRVSENIRHPKAWIYSQFAIANISSAILVSSNPTNLVLAGAFSIKFITYTANMIVPVVVTAIVLFPFLLYVVFADDDLIPPVIKMTELPAELGRNEPVNPNIPHGNGRRRGDREDTIVESGDTTAMDEDEEERIRLLSLEEVMNPFLDGKGAWFGSLVMATTLITVLVLNAVSTSSGQHSVYWVTLPAAFVMFCWDVASGWLRRDETRKIARARREQFAEARAERQRSSLALSQKPSQSSPGTGLQPVPQLQVSGPSPDIPGMPLPPSQIDDRSWDIGTASLPIQDSAPSKEHVPNNQQGMARLEVEDPEAGVVRQHRTLVSVSEDAFEWLQETFPTPVAVLMHLPVALVPFAFAMFILVQALVSKGWVRVFAHGWNHWVIKTSTVGAIGGMGFISVILCNFAGTNIGTTILLSRIIQQWYQIQDPNHPITDRTFWGTVYSMALGVNYGAFSTAFSASLAGLLWKDILARKSIQVHARDFARTNFPIIAISMAVGCAVLVGEIYIVRGDWPYIQPVE